MTLVYNVRWLNINQKMPIRARNNCLLTALLMWLYIRFLLYPPIPYCTQYYKVSSSLSCLTGEVLIQGLLWCEDNHLPPRHSDRLAHVAPPGGRRVRNRVQVVAQSQICRLVHDIGLKNDDTSTVKDIMFKMYQELIFVCLCKVNIHSQHKIVF